MTNTNTTENYLYCVSTNNNEQTFAAQDVRDAIRLAKILATVTDKPAIVEEYAVFGKAGANRHFIYSPKSEDVEIINF